MRKRLIGAGVAAMLLLGIASGQDGAPTRQTKKAPTEDTMKEERLDWIPPGKPAWHSGWINGYAQGLQVVANHLGPSAAPVDFDTVMGDLGVAFIMQADGDSVKRHDGHNDVGWWPLEPVGLIRLNFLERTIGRSMQVVAAPAGASMQDPIAFYRKWFEPAVRASIDGGKPCLAGFGGAGYIVTGYDTGTPCLFGMCSNQKSGEEKVDRIELSQPPCWVLVFGEAVDRIDRRVADVRVLRYAIDLHHDRVLGPGAEYAAGDPLRDAHYYRGRWHTGLMAFNCWIEWLKDKERYQEQARTHANSKGHLVRNREAAVRYLTAMQKRHPKVVADRLGNAITKYEDVVKVAQKIDTSPEAVSTAEGRQEMIAQIERVVEREKEAVAKIGKAVEALDAVKRD